MWVYSKYQDAVSIKVTLFTLKDLHIGYITQDYGPARKGHVIDVIRDTRKQVTVNFCGSSFSCQANALTSDSRIFWCAEEIMMYSVTARCPGAVVRKQYQIIISPPSCRQLVWGVCADMLRLWPNISTLVLHLVNTPWLLLSFHT